MAATAPSITSSPDIQKQEKASLCFMSAFENNNFPGAASTWIGAGTWGLSVRVSRHPWTDSCVKVKPGDSVAHPQPSSMRALEPAFPGCDLGQVNPPFHATVSSPVV